MRFPPAAFVKRYLFLILLIWLIPACAGGLSLITPPDVVVDPTPTESSRPSPTPQPTIGPAPTLLPPAATAPPTELPGFDFETALVTRIVDGDTIEVLMDGEIFRVRYIGINTPEFDQVCGPEASVANAILVAGQTVQMFKDVSETDRFGRLLRYVFVDDLFVNGELVRQGYAQAIRYPPDTALATVLESLEEEAPAITCAPLAAVTGTPRPTMPPVEPLPTSDGDELPPAPTISGLPAATPPVGPQPTAAAGILAIVLVDKVAEYVVIRNESAEPVNLAGWVLRSERGMQDCYLAGVIGAGEVWRIWAMAVDAPQGGYNCGFSGPIWSNNEPDPAVLIDPTGVEVARR
jgi:endonuclease YncB( thermonuclease family)